MSDGGVDSTTATILHVDLDAFFASVELLDRPDLVDEPVIVAHDSPRSVVTAANYPARKYGIRSAITVARAKQLCTRVHILRPHFEKYRAASASVMEVFESVTPFVEPLSIDEAFLDVAGARAAVGTPAQIGALIRRSVQERTGLTCSVGAAASKFVAKVASGLAKPDGMLVVPASETLEFLRPLPVGMLWGAGPVTQKTLLGRGLRTIGDVADTPLTTLTRALGDATGHRLHELSRGVDPRRVTPDSAEKSVGHEVTFDRDVADTEHLHRELLRQSTMVATRLRRKGFVGRTVALKLRYGDFTTITRSRTLAEPTDVARRIYDAVRELHVAVGEHPPVRLIGVRVEQLSRDGAALSLWDDGWSDAERALDSVAERFGGGAVRPASLLGLDGPRRPGTRWGPTPDS